jgi:hypothetical protein
MKIFFSILLSLSFLTSFSQNDTVKNKFSIGVAPLLVGTAFEDGLYFEYQRKEQISFELGGGVYNFIKYPLPWYSYNTRGFTIRSAIKLYRNLERIKHTGKLYYEILCFYRYMDFTDRYYNGDVDAILETTVVYHGNTDEESVTPQKAGNEIKHEICIESLWGRKYFIGKKEHFSFDFYYGFGARLKYRELSITKEFHSNQTIPVTASEKETIVSFLPSMHLGFKFAYSF